MCRNESAFIAASFSFVAISGHLVFFLLDIGFSSGKSVTRPRLGRLVIARGGSLLASNLSVRGHLPRSIGKKRLRPRRVQGSWVPFQAYRGSVSYGFLPRSQSRPPWPG